MTTAATTQAPEAQGRHPSPSRPTLAQLFARRPVGPAGAVRRSRSVDAVSSQAAPNQPGAARRLSLGDRPSSARGASESGATTPAAPSAVREDTRSSDDRTSATAPSPASSSAPPSPTEHAPAGDERAVILHPSRRYPELWQDPATPRGASTNDASSRSPGEPARAGDDRALILHPSRRYPELWQDPAAQRASSTHSSSTPSSGDDAPAGDDRALILHPSRRHPQLWQDPAPAGRDTTSTSASPTDDTPAGDDRAVILHPSRLHPELWHEPASPTAADHALPDEIGDEIAPAPEVVAPSDDAVEHTSDTAAARDSHETTRPPSAANIPLPESRTDSIASAASGPQPPPEQALARQRADYYKAWSYLGQGIGAAMAIAGWGVLLGLPMEARVALLIAQLGINVGSASKNALGSADDRHKGNQVAGDSEADAAKRDGSRRKARGQAISAGGGALSIVANAVPTAFPAPVPPLRAINGVAALLNAYGQIETGRGELRLGNPAKATGNFVASAANVAGAGGQFAEVGGGSKAAFPHAQGAGTLNSAMTPPGGAIDDARGSKRSWPYATDPKVVGQVLAFVGQGLSATALWMFNAHRVSASPQANQGPAQPDTGYLQTIAIIGLLGASILALGSGVSAYAEWPKTKAPGQDVELAVRPEVDHDAAPPTDPPART